MVIFGTRMALRGSEGWLLVRYQTQREIRHEIRLEVALASGHMNDLDHQRLS